MATTSDFDFEKSDSIRNDFRKLKKCSTFPMSEYTTLLGKVINAYANPSVVLTFLLTAAFKQSRADIIEYLFSCGARIANEHGAYTVKSRSIFNLWYMRDGKCASLLLDHILGADAVYFQHIKKCIDTLESTGYTIVSGHGSVFRSFPAGSISSAKLNELKIRMDIHTSVKSTREISLEKELADKTCKIAKLKRKLAEAQQSHATAQAGIDVAAGTLIDVYNGITGANEDSRTAKTITPPEEILSLVFNVAHAHKDQVCKTKNMLYALAEAMTTGEFITSVTIENTTLELIELCERVHENEVKTRDKELVRTLSAAQKDLTSGHVVSEIRKELARTNNKLTEVTADLKSATDSLALANIHITEKDDLIAHLETDYQKEIDRILTDKADTIASLEKELAEKTAGLEFEKNEKTVMERVLVDTKDTVSRLGLQLSEQARVSISLEKELAGTIGKTQMTLDIIAKRLASFHHNMLHGSQSVKAPDVQFSATSNDVISLANACESVHEKIVKDVYAKQSILEAHIRRNQARSDKTGEQLYDLAKKMCNGEFITSVTVNDIPGLIEICRFIHQNEIRIRECDIAKAQRKLDAALADLAKAKSILTQLLNV